MVTRKARVYGIVQGVGFRPTVDRHATACGIGGSVCNKGPFVEIIAQGAPSAVERFFTAVREDPPERAVILKMEIHDASPEETGEFSAFSIIESEKIRGDIFVSPDIAICEKCKKELYDPQNRRYLHPFINCTCCGPRLTILDSMPYDRVRTSMAEFPMCPACEKEYHDPATRRYDAQPVCCNDCGPGVYLLDENERDSGAITRARQAIAQGQIIAVKGIGGFHLCCDATSKEAVDLLRSRKNRPAKPFAVMMKDMDTVLRECHVLPSQREILDGHQKPILLLRKKEGGKVAQPVAPDNPKLGVMLPYTPLHLLLFSYPDGITVPDCLIMTSANSSGAPICRDDEDARKELSHLCDHVLSHDRLIRLRADDTVMDYYEDRPYMIRRSRGYAPLPFSLSLPWTGEVLAVGGELKNTFCLAKNQLYYPSPYVGDMGDVRTVKALAESVTRMEELLEARPGIVACDLHPRYNSSVYARTLGLPVLEVQHHYAHILSCMVENDVGEEKVIGVSYDGTGYGTDGTIWGGEILLADYQGFERAASISPFDQVGGDLSSREGWRIAVSLLKDCFGEEKAEELAQCFDLCSPSEASTLLKMAGRRINTVTSTSAGRLFDAVSALLGIRRRSTFEGEAACALQFAAERGKLEGEFFHEGYPTGLFAEEVWEQTGGRLILPTRALFCRLAEARLAGASPESTALAFHRALAALTVEACCRIRAKSGLDQAALSGGVFQNTLLLEETVRGLEEAGFKVYTHSMLPPGDGGICVGQAAAAMSVLNHKQNESQV